MEIDRLELSPRGVAAFHGDQPHSYQNLGASPAVGFSVVTLAPLTWPARGRRRWRPVDQAAWVGLEATSDWVNFSFEYRFCDLRPSPSTKRLMARAVS